MSNHFNDFQILQQLQMKFTLHILTALVTVYNYIKDKGKKIRGELLFFSLYKFS